MTGATLGRAIGVTRADIPKAARSIAHEAERLHIPVMHTPDVHTLAEVLLEEG